jgi:hypothetical protein
LEGQDPGWSQDKDQVAELVEQASQDPGWSQDKDQLAEQLVGHASQNPGWSQDKDQLAELVGQASQDPDWSQDKDLLAEQLVGHASQDPGWSQDKDQLAELVGQASHDPGWSQDKDQVAELVGQASQEAPGWSQDKDQLAEQLVGTTSQNLLIEQLINHSKTEKEEMAIAMAMTGQEADKPGGQLEPEKERAVKRKAAGEHEDEWEALLASQEEGPENMDMEQSPVNEETRGGDQREKARAPSWLDIQV